MAITAKITASPSSFIDPEAGGYARSVDAIVYRDGEELCEVTLLPEQGVDPDWAQLETWGDPDCWCSDYSACLDDHGDVDHDLVALIVEAVNAELE